MAAWDDREYGLLPYNADVDRALTDAYVRGCASVREAVGKLHKPEPFTPPWPGADEILICRHCGSELTYAPWPCATAVAAGLA